MQQPVIVGIGGTLRPNSSSEIALKVALQAAEKAGAIVEIIAGRDLLLPPFDPSVTERDGLATRLVAAFRRADGIIISSPGYHGSVSGMLKNAIDYVEDLSKDERAYFTDRAVGCIVSASGTQALGSTLQTLRSIVHATRGWNTPFSATINSDEKPFSADGIVDPRIRAQLELVGKQVVDFAKMVGNSGSCR
jgi:FMN reductase